MKINVLGTEYEISYVKDQPKMKANDSCGYLEPHTKKIFIDDFEADESSVDRLDKFKEQVLRHEIIHAYFFESGLDSNSEYARNEELIDWLALQIPKIARTLKELDILD